MAGAILTTGHVDYCTPGYILDAAYNLIGDHFDLDPCTNPKSIVRAKRHILRDPYVLPDKPGWEYGDGLRTKWSGKIWLNPPFGKMCGEFVDHAYTQWVDNDAQILMVVPAAVETWWWQEYILNEATAICWLKKRVKFLDQKSGCPRPCVVVYYAADYAWSAFRDCFEELGVCTSSR